MIAGEYHNSIDEKGRLSLPTKLRSDIPGSIVVITQGVDKCLWLFPPEEWQRISESLMSSTSLFQSRARLIQRRIIAPAQEVEIDKTGRINIAPSLREYAGLTRDAVILGIKSYVEIWDEATYRDYWADKEAEFQEAAEELGKIISV